MKQQTKIQSNRHFRAAYQDVRQKGFTLIELMIATTIFSIVLMVILASFLQVGRMYYKGVSVSSTNESARTLVDDITSDIRLGSLVDGPHTDTDPSNHYFCIGSHRYSYKLSTTDHQVKGTDVSNPSATNPTGVVLEDVSGCNPPSAPGGRGTNARQLLGANMQLNKLQFGSNPSQPCTVISGTVSTCNVQVRVVYYGIDDSVLVSPTTGNPDPNNSDAVCSGNLLSTQFCSVAEFDTDAITSF